MSLHRFTDARQAPRIRVPAMYSDVRARPKGKRRFVWTGHVYDISRTGMRFEFDEKIDPGTALDVRLTLPGRGPKPIRLTGRVVRIDDDDEENGPAIMAMSFGSFNSEADVQRLDSYLAAHGLRAAA